MRLIIKYSLYNNNPLYVFSDHQKFQKQLYKADKKLPPALSKRSPVAPLITDSWPGSTSR